MTSTGLVLGDTLILSLSVCACIVHKRAHTTITATTTSTRCIVTWMWILSVFFSFRCCWFVKCCVWRWLVVWLCKCNNKQICLFVDQNGNFLLLFCFCSVLSHVLTFYTLFIYFSPFLRSRYVSLLTPRSVMEHKYRIGVVVLYNACIYDKRKFPRYCYGRISLIYYSVLSTNTSWRMAMPPFKATTPYKICIVKGCARGNAQSSSQLACYFTIWKTNSRYAFWI